jgi:hypothetical protein
MGRERYVDKDGEGKAELVPIDLGTIAADDAGFLEPGATARNLARG